MTMLAEDFAWLYPVWITFTVWALLTMTAVMVWAVRSRQFSNQDHARRLPLECEFVEGMKTKSQV